MNTLNSCPLVFILDDFSRVKLKEIKGEEGSDYINASFIDVSTISAGYSQQ